MRKDWWRINVSNETTSDDIEVNRKKLGIISFALIGGSITLLYGIFTPSESGIILRTALIFCALYLYVIAFSLRYHSRYNLAFDFCGYGIIIPLLVIISSGGYENTALYWAFPFLIALFMFLGHLKGLIVNVILFGIIYWMCVNQEYIQATYSQAQSTRFLASYAICIFICFSAEYFRLQNFNRLVVINTDTHKLANSDALTGLPNRRFVDAEFLPNAESSPKVYFPMVVVVIDIDHFKQVNDNYGHLVGDEVLKHIANCFTRCTRDTDLLSRIGGEEFLMLVPKSELSTGIGIAEKIRDIIERTPLTINDQQIRVTISAGVALAENRDLITDALSAADELMYQAKRKGRNRVESLPRAKTR